MTMRPPHHATSIRWRSAIAIPLAMLVGLALADQPPTRTPEVKAALNAATTKCSSIGNVVDCFNGVIHCADSTGGNDVGRFHACVQATPYASTVSGPSPVPAPATLVLPPRRGDRYCAHTSIPGEIRGKPMQRAGTAIAFVDDLAGDRIKLSISGLMLFDSVSTDAQFRQTGTPSYRGTALVPGNILWIDGSALADWSHCN